VVHLTEPRPETDAELSQIADDAVRNHFQYRAERTRRELRDLLRRGRISLVIALAFAGGCVVAGNAIGRAGDSALYQIAQESLSIGGWVALWRPLEIFLYDWWPLRRVQLAYERLAHMHTSIVCDAV
jgi:hypothetical protein